MTWLQRFSTIISTCLLLPLLFTLSCNAIFALAIFFPMAKLAFQWKHSIWKATIWEVYLISVTHPVAHIIPVTMVVSQTTGPSYQCLWQHFLQQVFCNNRPAIWCSQIVNRYSLSHACTNFPKIHHQHKICRHQKGNMTQGPYCGPTNIKCHLTKCRCPTWLLGLLQPRFTAPLSKSGTFQ